MSWQAYVDTNLVGSGLVSEAAIADRSGRSIWARSSGFQWTPDEVSTVAAKFTNDDSRFLPFLIGGLKYDVVRADYEVFYARCGQVGFVVVPTTNGLVIATYEQGLVPGYCLRQVLELADYLKGVGY